MIDTLKNKTKMNNIIIITKTLIPNKISITINQEVIIIRIIIPNLQIIIWMFWTRLSLIITLNLKEININRITITIKNIRMKFQITISQVLIKIDLNKIIISEKIYFCCHYCLLSIIFLPFVYSILYINIIVK